MIDVFNCIKASSEVGDQDKTNKKIAYLHKYWSRKPFNLIEDCILRYSKKGNVVVDPFCGSGSTGLGAILNDREYIGYDLNPSAIFITDCTLDTKFDSSAFEEEFKQIVSDLKSRIMELYRVGESRFILYAFSGKAPEQYNAVTADYDFKDKNKELLSSENISPAIEIPSDLSYPDKEFPKRFYKDRFSYKGVKNVSDMFTRRNLLALAVIYNYLNNSDFKYKKLFQLALSNTILHVSKLKAENVRPLSVNNYWIPDDNIEENVIWRFIDRVKRVKSAKEVIRQKQNSRKSKANNYKLINKSSIFLDDISDNTIDYIITDPPYGDVIQYSELSYIWNCWFGQDFFTEDEVIINPAQDKDQSDFQGQISIFLENTYRVLKPNAFFTLCFQNKDVDIWLKIILKIKSIGFTLEDIRIYDTLGSPYNKHWAKFSPKADLYVTFRKKEKRTASKGEITPDAIIDTVIDHIGKEDFDLNKGYDLFVASVINYIFNGYDIISLDKWNLKKIISIYEQRIGTE